MKHTSEEIKYRLSDLGVQIGNIAIEYIAELEKENAELKEQNSKAKELLKKAIRCTWSIDYFVVDEINEFLKEKEQ